MKEGDAVKIFRSQSLFETVIRDLGGLLSAYDLSGREQLLSAATLVERFDTEPFSDFSAK